MFSNERVNRSLIGQQSALSTDNEVTLLSTTAPAGRQRGTGDISGDTNVSVNGDSENSSNNATVSPTTSPFTPSMRDIGNPDLL